MLKNQFTLVFWANQPYQRLIGSFLVQGVGKLYLPWFLGNAVATWIFYYMGCTIDQGAKISLTKALLALVSCAMQPHEAWIGSFIVQGVIKLYLPWFLGNAVANWIIFSMGCTIYQGAKISLTKALPALVSCAM
jgi:hypothetical protein